MLLMTEDPIVYQDRPGRRVLDLRPDDIDCIPVLGLSDFQMIRPGTDYHIHPGCIEICLCVRGNLTFETDGRSYPFLPGCVFVSTDREPHRMRHAPKGLVVYRVLFQVPKPGRRVLGLTQRETEWIVRMLRHLPKRLFKSTERIREAFRTLFVIHDNERLTAARTVKLKAGVLDLLVGVIEAARLLPGKAPETITDLMRTMREHPDRDYPIGQLAAQAALSASGFSEAFKGAAGLPPHAYLISCRIAKAQKVLATGNKSIKAIAGLLHFSSPQHFSNVFKRIVGTSPAAYAKSVCGSRNRSANKGHMRMALQA